MQGEGFRELVREAQAGSPQATDTLLAVVRPYLNQIAKCSRGPSGPEASRSDLVQVACLRAWQRLDQFRSDGSDEEVAAAFRAWVGQIYRSMVLNWERDAARKRRRPEKPIVSFEGGNERNERPATVDPADQELTPATQAAIDDDRRSVREAIEKLDDPIAREIIWMRFYDDVNLQEIARRLEIAYPEVRRRFHESLDRLADELDGEFGAR